VGPDLKGVTTRRERAWLTRYVQAPDQVLAARDPVATALFRKYKEVRMPNLNLRPEEVAGVLSYLESHGGAPGQAQAARR
jgi:protein SCO1